MKVIEMFAGVGGFRIGFQNASSQFKYVWANQFEPGTKTQTAWQIYEKNFGENSCLNKNISDVNPKDIPDFDILTAGFPCQDYSVAKSLKYSNGIEGKKGVLWWDIMRVTKEKKPSFLVLENVDRLISSPSKQRGRDFAIILKSLHDLNYFVEWKIINAAEYGFPQKRKRIFIVAVKKTHETYKKIKSNKFSKTILSEAFPSLEITTQVSINIEDSIIDVSEQFGKKTNKSPFLNQGFFDTKIITTKYTSQYNNYYTNLKDIVLPLKNVDKSFIIEPSELASWQKSKGGMRVERIDKKTGHKYIYSEGKMSCPDSLDKPARTIITGEGGSSPSRFKHIIQQGKTFRRLTPIELERINMFPDNHTNGATDVKRAFLMGNALVTGVVTNIAKSILVFTNNK